jgi:hypothetical protein
LKHSASTNYATACSLHLSIQITNENSETVIYTDYLSTVKIAKLIRPSIKDRKEKEYTENFGESITWKRTIWKAKDDTEINLTEYSVRMVGNGIWLWIKSNGRPYLPSALFSTASRALFTSCLLLGLLFNSENGGNLFFQKCGFLQTAWYYNYTKCIIHLYIHQ